VQVEQQITGRFRPGQSGNPRGRLSRAEQRARVASQVAEWATELAALGVRVGAVERGLLQRAAELSLLHPRRNEDAIRTANALSRLLSQAGFRKDRRQQPARSAVAQLVEGEFHESGGG
jgi:hypothetical protein